MTHQLTYAQAFSAAGCVVIPARADGSKAPAVDWKIYQQQHPDAAQLERWFGPYDGMGVVTGAISGHLEMLELEARAADLGPQLAQMLADHDAADLWSRLCNGYLEQSAGGGYHWLYRVDGAPARGNTKLARRPATTAELAENPLDKVKVLIETRGEGGFVVTAPSNGTTHPTGRPWVLLAGGPATIPTITAAERDLLWAIASTFNAMPVEPTFTSTRSGPTPSTTRTTRSADDELRPGDDYEQRTDWADILEPHGWTRSKRLGRGFAWTRPGKHPRDGFSATTGQADDADRLYVFSSSTIFETETPYNKFGAYALLEHGGDHAAAASQLRRDGYGAPLEETRPLTFTGPPAAPEPVGPDDSVGGAAHSAPVPTATIAAEPRSYSLTDDGNALRLVDAHHNGIRYVPERQMWLRWTGHRWAWDKAGVVREHARDIARNLPADNDQRARHRTKSLSANAISAQVRLAQTDQRVVAPIDTLDAHPFQLNTPAGAVDLRTGVIAGPDPTQLHTRSTNVAPDFTAAAPRWQQFLATTFAGDPDLTTYVQRLIGISLIGEVLEQILPFAHGSGANGKTTLLGTIQRIVGFGETGYAISAPSEMLIATRNQDHPATIAQMAGARLVVTSELDEGQTFAEARVKLLTGRDAINARFMAQNPFTFTPSHTLWLLGNHRPQVRSGGRAFWRRVREIPFEHTVPDDQQDQHLEDRLVDEEGEAILAWCIRGAADYLQHGLTVPASVQAATEAYQLDQDTVTRFVADMCETGDRSLPHLRTKVSTVRIAYEHWCNVEGETPVTSKGFTTALRNQHDVGSERSHGVRYFLGISVVDDAAPGTPNWPDRRSGQTELTWGQS